MNIKQIVIGAVATVALVFGGLAFFRGTPAPTDTSQNFGSLPGPNINSPWITVGSVGQWYSRASCNTASSTLFAIQNPWSATSTIDFATISGTVGATTTDILIGTSTTPYNNAPYSVVTTATTTYQYPVFFGMGQLATSSQFFSALGSAYGPSQGYNQPHTTYYTGVGTTSDVVVGPSQYVVGFATSSYAGSGNGSITAGLQGIPASCTFIVQWFRGN